MTKIIKFLQFVKELFNKQTTNDKFFTYNTQPKLYSRLSTSTTSSFYFFDMSLEQTTKESTGRLANTAFYNCKHFSVGYKVNISKKKPKKKPRNKPHPVIHWNFQ